MNAPGMRDKGIDLLMKARDADVKGDYETALNTYQSAIQYLLASIKYEKNENVKSALQDKVKEYLQRAEELKDLIEKNPQVLVSTNKNNNNPATGQKKRRGDEKALGDQDDPLKESLKETIMQEKPNVQWSDIGGLEDAKEALKEAVILPLKAPQLFEKRLEPWKAILLYGPPGTGKTELAKAIATHCNSTFFAVKGSNIVSKFVGESERLIKQLFDMARASKPAIIFIDEIDSIASSRKDSDTETAARIKTELLQQTQGVDSDSKGILVLAATNLPWNLDGAILRRFQRRIYIPLPDKESRKKILEVSVKHVPHTLTSQDFVKLAEMTENYSGSDLKVVAQDARYEEVRALKHATHFKKVNKKSDSGDIVEVWMPCSPGDVDAVEMTYNEMDEKNLLGKLELRPVSMKDFEKAVSRSRPVANKEMIKQCEEFTRASGTVEQ